jgi:hypothetical protein
MAVDPDFNRGGAAPPSYINAMLLSPTNLTLGAGVLATAAFLSIPFGLPGLVLPLLAFGAGEAIAAMFIPASPTFRAKVDHAHKLKRRNQAEHHLRSEIMQRADNNDRRWQIYSGLRERVASLRQIGLAQRSGLSERDLDKIEDTGLDFLGLWLAELSMRERQRSVDERDLTRRIESLDQRLKAGADDDRSLRKAKSDLEELLLRHRRLASRKAAVEAAILSLPDAVEEIYQAVITQSAAGGGPKLNEALERLRLEEELEQSYGQELAAIAPSAAVKARPALQVVKR